MSLERGSRVPTPGFPLTPSRERFSNRTRLILAIVLAGAIAVAVGLSVLLATGSGKVAGRAVAIPLADRSASPALLLAAEQVGFHPVSAAGTGQIEGEPASFARAPSSGLLAVGSQAPEFTLRTPEGVPVSLASLRGKAVLLEFFATWCPHCGAEAPHLEALYRSLPHARIAFLAVNADGEDAASVLAYHIYFGMQYPALLDPGSRQGSFRSPGPLGPVSARYKVGVYPTFYVLDPRGRILWRSDGEQPDAALRAELLQAAGGAAAGVGGHAAGGACSAASGCSGR